MGRLTDLNTDKLQELVESGVLDMPKVLTIKPKYCFTCQTLITTTNCMICKRV